MAPRNAKALVSGHMVVGANAQYHVARLLWIRRLGVRVPPSALDVSAGQPTKKPRYLHRKRSLVCHGPNHAAAEAGRPLCCREGLRPTASDRPDLRANWLGGTAAT